MRKKIIAMVGAAVFVLALGVMVHAQDKPANIAGAWDLAQPGRDGAVNTQSMTITQDGGTITGSIKGGRGDSPLAGTVKGNSVTFTVTRQGRGGEVKVDYTGTFDGTALKGTYMMGTNTVNWSATKSK